MAPIVAASNGPVAAAVLSQVREAVPLAARRGVSGDGPSGAAGVAGAAAGAAGTGASSGAGSERSESLEKRKRFSLSHDEGSIGTPVWLSDKTGNPLIFLHFLCSIKHPTGPARALKSRDAHKG